MKMIGIRHRSALSLACNSKPDMPGIRISTIRHAISGNWPDFNKSSADPNETAPKPEAFRRRCNAPRTNSSSSTTAIKFFLAMALISDAHLSLRPRDHNYALYYAAYIFG